MRHMRCELVTPCDTPGETVPVPVGYQSLRSQMRTAIDFGGQHQELSDWTKSSGKVLRPLKLKTIRGSPSRSPHSVSGRWRSGNAPSPRLGRHGPRDGGRTHSATVSLPEAA